jgi:hypothetical protein
MKMATCFKNERLGAAGDPLSVGSRQQQIAPPTPKARNKAVRRETPCNSGYKSIAELMYN